MTTETTPEAGMRLAPCPFCGGQARIAESVIPRSYGCQVGCDECATYKVRQDGLQARTARQAAITAWNTRAAAPVPPAGGEGEALTFDQRLSMDRVRQWLDRHPLTAIHPDDVQAVYDLAARAQPPVGGGEPICWGIFGRTGHLHGTVGQKQAALDWRDEYLTCGHVAPLYAHPTEPAARDGGEADVQYEVWQDDMLVAASDILSDAQHFAMIYGQDDPLDVIVATTYRVPLAAGGEK